MVCSVVALIVSSIPHRFVWGMRMGDIRMSGKNENEGEKNEWRVRPHVRAEKMGQKKTETGEWVMSVPPRTHAPLAEVRKS